MKIEPELPSHLPPVLTLMELRVLSGLSKGAALPFETELVIGSDFSCDLILVDPGIAGKHARLQQIGSAFVLTVMPGAEISGRSPRSSIEPGMEFEIAGVRLLLASSDAAWDFALPHVRPAQAVSPESPIDRAVAAGMAAGSLGPHARLKVSRSSSGSTLRWALLIIVIAVAIAIAWAVQYLESSSPPPQPSPAPARRAYGSLEVQKIAAAFSQRLDEIGVTGMKVDAAPQLLTVKGPVAVEAEGRFEHAVQQLRDSNAGLKVRLELGGNAASVLPFEVAAAVGGANGSVLLADGQQLFVGAEEAGFRFLGLIGSCVEFLHVDSQRKVSQCSQKSPLAR